MTLDCGIDVGDFDLRFFEALSVSERLIIDSMMLIFVFFDSDFCHVSGDARDLTKVGWPSFHFPKLVHFYNPMSENG